MIRDRRHHIIGDRTGAAFRVYMGGSAIVNGYIGITEPGSLMYPVSATSDGIMLMWIMMVIGTLALFDAIINDFLPRHLMWFAAVNNRHFIMAGMAFCYASQLYIAFIAMRSNGILLYYIWNTGIILFVTMIDAKQRERDSIWSKFYI